jgi:acyl-homoserine lactone acylase PvdQ
LSTLILPSFPIGQSIVLLFPSLLTALRPNRVNRINELLAAKQKHSLADMQRMQADLVSHQAEMYMKHLKPLLKVSDPYDALLAAWNCSYDAETKGAVIFEQFYEKLVRLFSPFPFSMRELLCILPYN